MNNNIENRWDFRFDESLRVEVDENYYLKYNVCEIARMLKIKPYENQIEESKARVFDSWLEVSDYLNAQDKLFENNSHMIREYFYQLVHDNHYIAIWSKMLVILEPIHIVNDHYTNT